jgi:threonine dehydratase
LGANVVLEGSSLAEARAAMDRLARQDNLTVIHPYDDGQTIAGQGTIALEFLERFPQLDCLVVPVGGGGLISGVSVAAKHLNPAIEIIGVEAAFFPSMRNALTGERNPVGGRTTAEGIAVAEVGTLTRKIAAEHVSDVVLVNEDEIERAMLAHVREQRIVVEGAGAAPLAAITKQPDRYRGRKVGLIVSGGNVDARLLSSILLRGLARDGYLVRIRIEIEDRPGELAEIAELIGQSGGNIVEVVHQRLFHDIPVKQAEVDVTLETRDRNHIAALLASLTRGGFPARLLGNTADD